MAEFMMRHKWLTMSAWLVLAFLGARFAGTTMRRMDYSYTTPGQPGFIANQHILESFAIDGTFESFLAVLHLPKGSKAANSGFPESAMTRRPPVWQDR